MLSYNSQPGSRVVEITVDGPVDREEFDSVIAALDATIARHGSVDVLEEVRRVGAMSPSVIWHDLKWVARNRRKVRRAAVVSDRPWIGPMVKAIRPLWKAELRHFDGDDIDDARRWLDRDES